MHTKKKLFLLYFLMALSLGCQTEIWQFPSETSEGSSRKSYSPQEWLAYCNSFDQNGFRGILTAYFDAETNDYSTNKVWLHLFSVPHAFSGSKFIQIHPFNVENNRTKFNKQIDSEGKGEYIPAHIEIIRNSNKDKIRTVTSIDHDLLKDMGHLPSISEMIDNYGFILHNLSGWKGLSLAVFQTNRNAITDASVRILKPPFLSNPHTFAQRNDSQPLLSKLHPFSNIVNSQFQTEDEYYNKASEICSNQSPIPIQILSFEEQIHSKEQEAEEKLLPNSDEHQLWKNIFELTK